jgi:hypothetical protein
MSMVRVALGWLFIVSAVFATGVNAADLSSLEMGNFNIKTDSIVKPESVAIKNNLKNLTVSMRLDSLVANADGQKTEGSSSMEGNFVVQQPQKVSLPFMTVQLRGHIVKTKGSTASLDITIGSALKTIKWNADEVAAKAFDITITEAIPNGELPVLLPVSAIALVNKEAGAGAVLVSLESIDVTFTPLNVASE